MARKKIKENCIFLFTITRFVIIIGYAISLADVAERQTRCLQAAVRYSRAGSNPAVRMLKIFANWHYQLVCYFFCYWIFGYTWVQQVRYYS